MNKSLKTIEKMVRKLARENPAIPYDYDRWAIGSESDWHVLIAQLDIPGAEFEFHEDENSFKASMGVRLPGGKWVQLPEPVNIDGGGLDHETVRECAEALYELQKLKSVARKVLKAERVMRKAYDEALQKKEATST